MLLLLLLLSCFSHVRLYETPETAAHQAPPSLGFSRQEYWSRGLTTWVSLEWDPEIRVAPVEENSVLDTSLNEVFFVLH